MPRRYRPTGGPLPAILEAMRARERRRQEVSAQLGSLAKPAMQLPDAAVYRELGRRLTDWQGRLLDRHPADAGGVLRDLLNGRLIVTPTLIEGGRWFEFKGEATFGLCCVASSAV